VIGQLVRYENGVCGDALQTVTFNTTVPADKTFTIVYAVPEAPGDYVSFVIVKTPQGFVIADHQDCASETQRVSVVGDTLPETH